MDFSGIWTAIVTPFNDRLGIDFQAYGRLLDRQVKAKVAGVVPCGTTGETPTLSLDEQKEVISFTIKHLKGSGLKVMAGTGSNNTASTMALSRWASEAGADALLVVVPYYNRPTQNGLRNHFTKVAEAATKPIVLYNIPSRTGVRMEVETAADLAHHGNIRAIKESTGELTAVSDLLAKFKEDGTSMSVLSGDDALFLGSYAVGASGVISVASNLVPEQLVRLHSFAEKGDLKEATAIHRKLYPLFKSLFIESNPAPCKYAMSRMGLCSPAVREPLIEMTLQSKDLMTDTLISLGLIHAS